MIWPTQTEQGYDFATLGRNRRLPISFDGIQLVSFVPPDPEQGSADADADGIPF